MTPDAIIRYLAIREVSLLLKEGKLIARCAGNLAPELVEMIRSNKVALIEHLDWLAKEEAKAKIPFDWNRPAAEQELWLAKFPDGSYLALTKPEMVQLGLDGSGSTVRNAKEHGNSSAKDRNDGRRGCFASSTLWKETEWTER